VGDEHNSEFLKEHSSWMNVEVNTVNINDVSNSLGFGRTENQWHQDWIANQKTILEFYQSTFPVANVICIFENEESQRNCLQHLVIGIIPALLDWKDQLNKLDLFRGTNALFVSEALEPCDIIWANLGKGTATQRSLQRVVCFGFLALIGAFFSSLVWYMMREVANNQLTAMTISVIAQTTPILIRMNVDMVEVHVSITHRQWSLMAQMFIFLSCNAAVIIYTARDALDTLSETTVRQVADVLFFNSVIGPLREYSKLMPNSQRSNAFPFSLCFFQSSSFSHLCISVGDFRLRSAQAL
jgi:hypothetical protein